MDTRELIENIETYTVSGGRSYDSRSSIPSSYCNPIQLRRRTFDSNFYFDEHTKRRSRSTGKAMGSSPSPSYQCRHLHKQSVRITPTKVFQGVLFNIPEIRDDDVPPMERNVQSFDLDHDSSMNNNPVHFNRIDSQPQEEKASFQSNSLSQEHANYNIERDRTHTDSIMVKRIQSDVSPKDENVAYWTTVAVKVAQTIVMNGGQPHHAEEAQMIILDCARDQSLSLRKDGSSIIASKISISLLKLGASEYVVTKAATMFLKCVSTSNIVKIQGFYDDFPLRSKINQGIRSGSDFLETGCEIGSAFVSNVTEYLRSACAYAVKEKPARKYSSSYSSFSTDDVSDDEWPYQANSLVSSSAGHGMNDPKSTTILQNRQN